jgi:hypothetical protein
LFKELRDKVEKEGKQGTSNEQQHQPTTKRTQQGKKPTYNSEEAVRYQTLRTDLFTAQQVEDMRQAVKNVC